LACVPLTAIMASYLVKRRQTKEKAREEAREEKSTTS